MPGDSAHSSAGAEPLPGAAEPRGDLFLGHVHVVQIAAAAGSGSHYRDCLFIEMVPALALHRANEVLALALSLLGLGLGHVCSIL